MKEFLRKYHRVIAVILAVIILLGSIPIITGEWNENNVSAMENASSEDKRIASEISNTTGAKIEEVFRLKNNGRTWNEVLSVLKNKYNSGADSQDDRDNVLLNSGLDEEYINKLKEEGFLEENITEVRMLEERVIFQLQEIVSGSQTGVDKPTADTVSASTGKEEDDISAYNELLEKIDIKNAVYFMLKLKDDFGSYEKVFDEYLYSLQADLDLNEYVKDKKAYSKNKDDKKLLIDEQKVITLEKIEEKSIEQTQKEPEDSTETASSVKNNNTKNSVTNDKSPLPDVPKPAIEDVKPKNPTDEVMNEIKEINPIGN